MGSSGYNMELNNLEVDHCIMSAIKEYLNKYNYVDTLRTLEVRGK